MAAVKKSELYAQLWKSCDDLRGGMDASEYKNYILVLLFVKYVSDKFKGDPFADIVIPEGCSFDDIVTLKGKDGIGEGIDKILAKLAEANETLGNVINVVSFNDPAKLGSGKELKDRLTGLIGNFEKEELNFQNNRIEDDDILGDAYEYLMRKFATESGKSKGQFYTPAEVSRVLAKVVKIREGMQSQPTLYDPACGSGSLLIRAAEESGRIEKLAIYGQESETTTSGLARMNMVLHSITTAEITQGNTLANPQFTESGTQLKQFDYIVVNPPFSLKSWTKGVFHGDKNPIDPFRRYTSPLIPPEKNGDYAWMLHVLRSLKEKGRAALILPHGVLFRGNAEGEIRKYFVNSGFIEGIIGLPPNLFYGTGIPACIVVLDKEHAAGREGIFMINASSGFVKDGSKNRLREQDIRKITDVYLQGLEIPKYSRFVPIQEIKDTNGYNLNLPRYIDVSEQEDIQDINAHLHGGIPLRDVDALDRFWQMFPTLRESLFAPLREGYCNLKMKPDEVSFQIGIHPEFEQQGSVVLNLYTEWESTVEDRLWSLEKGDRPKPVICFLADEILQKFSDVPLLDKYDVYQVLLSYADAAMRDDLYTISGDGWEAGRVITYEYKKDKSGKPTSKVASFDGLLIPKEILAQTSFPEMVAELSRLQGEYDSVTQQIEEMLEEMSGEDGYLADLVSEKRQIVKTKLNARMKEIKKDPDSAEEYSALTLCNTLLDAQSEAKSGLKREQEKLDTLLVEKYPTLTIEEIKSLVIEKKWSAAISLGIETLYDTVSHELGKRITELAKSYEFTLPEILEETAELEKKVREDLETMGYVW